MKRAAEVKWSARCSQEPVAGGDGTMRSVGVGVVTNKKRPRKAADKPSKKKEKRSEEEKKKKRSKKKKRAEDMWTEKIASNKVEEPAAAGDGGAATPMLLSRELLEYLRTKEVMGLLATEAPLEPWASRMAGSLFDQTLKEEIAAEFQENREFDAHVLYQYRTYGHAYAEEETELQAETKSKKKKKKKLAGGDRGDDSGRFVL